MSIISLDNESTRVTKSSMAWHFVDFQCSGPCKLSHRVTSTVGWLGRTGVGGHVKREPTPDLIGSDQEGK